MKRVAYIEQPERWREEFDFYINIHVRFSETDLFGHMNNTSPFIYFEEARIAFMKSVGLIGERFELGEQIPVVADLQCDYHQQVFFDEKLRVFVKLAHTGRTSYDLHYMVLNERNEVCLTARGRVVHIDYETGEKVSIPEPFRRTHAVH
ncbi:hypothetical protein N781_10340 [Pontibacillus halophilus JSM 076056 = DSM 19796]|uniref:4-hydroxybenzoyl-CoA thioesterase n=1 Tax=Pontibacillus halophilus JSM 076056 = DSM 19796 TaxID=1385510 RepID=A0A0A5IC74_9BACI|nr:thioesterase family protein [Pontibacillus halophilus]KGX93442.1 hypothetical protein N781_10340 [Pontibacillus halophilus JSM 076056 = DSM 19796]